jgi:c-di-GMP-binding flagellar brake protein YcgR
MKTEEKDTKPRTGIVNFERRKYPRFSVNLPVEYYQINSSISHTGRALNASEGGLLIYFPELMEIGQHLKLKLFFTSGSKMNTIETLVQVVWIDIHLGEGWGDYRTGVRFVDISQEDLERLKNFLRSLSSP